MSGSAVVVTASSSEETANKPIPANGLVNTGLGAAGDLDPYWKIISVPSDTPGFTAGSNAIIMTANPVWGSSPAWSSKYIGVTADGNTGVPGGTYIYELSIASAKYNTTSVAVYFLVDDQVTSVEVSDGHHGGVIQSVTKFSGSGSGNTCFSSFTLTAFGPTVTILTFTVLNIGRRPSGLLVQFGEFTYIPGCPNPVPFCPAGTHLMSAGSLSCDSWPAGSSSSEGATYCSPCPTGMISSPSLSLSPSFSSAPSNGLQLYYRFDSVSGSRVGNMASGSVVYDATLENGAVVSNNQLQLSASGGQYMSIDSFTTGTTGLTFATWWRSDNSENWAKVFDFGNHVRADNIIMTKNPTDGTLLVQLYVLNSHWRDLSASFRFDTQNAWNHVAWTLDPSGSGTWIVYINGVQVGSASPAPYPRSILRSNNFLGRSNWESNPPLNGGIKDFRMYSRVLSAAEVHTLFTSTQKIFIGASHCAH